MNVRWMAAMAAAGWMCASGGAAAADEGGWKSLFNGRDLAGWAQVGQGIYGVEDGCLIGTQTNGQGGDLVTAEEFDNFELRFTYKIDWPANSGIWFRFNDGKGYQFDMLKWPKPVAYSGTLYCPGKLFITRNLAEAIEKKDDWNEGLIRACGDEITMRLNGETVGYVRDRTHAKGKIGIQVHGGNGFINMKIALRRIEIRPLPAPADPAAAPAVPFALHRVGFYRSEACGVADFNKDGKLDIVAGDRWYEAPEWKPHVFREVAGEVSDEGKGYRDDFMNAALDVDGDGYADVVACSWFAKRMTWYRNPGAAGGEWPMTVIETNGNYETGDLWDVDGDGHAREIMPATKDTAWFDIAPGPDGKAAFRRHAVDPKPRIWGNGVGDVNGDGRPDLLRPDAWFEAPADPRAGKWTERAWALGGPGGKVDHVPQILVFDVNGDGKNDVITSSAHKHGIFWYEQVRDGGAVSWRQHTIDDTWSQAHSLALADIDGDGTPDLVTGKRFMAHNGGDPDEPGKLGVYWYGLKRGPTPQWTKHTMAYDLKIGSGVTLCATDLNGDGDVDVIVTGKWGGPAVFENRRK